MPPGADRHLPQSDGPTVAGGTDPAFGEATIPGPQATLSEKVCFRGRQREVSAICGYAFRKGEVLGNEEAVQATERLAKDILALRSG